MAPAACPICLQIEGIVSRDYSVGAQNVINRKGRIHKNPFSFKIGEIRKCRVAAGACCSHSLVYCVSTHYTRLALSLQIDPSLNRKFYASRHCLLFYHTEI